MTPLGAPRDPARVVEEPPPFLRTWGRVYAAVALYLFSLIVLFYLFTRTVSS